MMLFPRTNFLNATLGYNPSHTWRSILQARMEVIDHAGLWRVGDGQSIQIWGDNWLPFQQGHKIWSPQPPNCILSNVADPIHPERREWNAQLINDIFLSKHNKFFKSISPTIICKIASYGGK